jgi:hypothetical protein
MKRMMPSMDDSSGNLSNFAAGGGGLGGGGLGELFKSSNLNPNALMQSKLYEFKHPIKRIDWALLSAICLPLILRQSQIYQNTNNF